jgi:dTDP-4-dehydrorhamnose 3,5-epimerase
MSIDGLKIIDLKVNLDARGSYTEMYRDNWEGAPSLSQWSIVRSSKGAIRGMRIHVKHTDYTCLVSGQGLYVLKDLRKNSPTFGQNEYLELRGDKLQGIVTPPGVAHGFYFQEDSLFVVGITHHYDPADELGFYYKDPEAGLTWPAGDHIIVDHDKQAPPLQTVLPLMPSWVKND